MSVFWEFVKRKAEVLSFFLIVTVTKTNWIFGRGGGKMRLEKRTPINFQKGLGYDKSQLFYGT